MHDGFVVGNGKPKVIYRPVQRSVNEKGNSSKDVVTGNKFGSLIDLTEADESKESEMNPLDGKKIIKEDAILDKLFEKACGNTEMNWVKTSSNSVGNGVEDHNSDTESDSGKTASSISGKESEGARTPGKSGYNV